MKAPKRTIAVDVGAGSARTTIGEFDGANIKSLPMGRFLNRQMRIGRMIYFDFFHIAVHVQEAIVSCLQRFPKGIDSIAIDSFGASFGLLDKEGDLLAGPVSYRDAHYRKGEEALKKIISIDQLDARNHSKTYPHCALFLLFYLYREKKRMAQAIGTFLPVANLLAWTFGAEVAVDPSILSGSQFFDVRAREYLTDILEGLKIDPLILPPIQEDYGQQARFQMTGHDRTQSKSTPKMSLVCSHDTASCVSGLPLEKKDAFLISGTWSVIGVEKEEPMALQAIGDMDFTNWNGFQDRILFVKIYSGFYFYQEIKTAWQKKDPAVIDDDRFFRSIPLKSAEGCLIDLNAPMLFDDSRDMVEKIFQFFEQSGQKHEKTFECLATAVLRSIVLEYRIAFAELEKAIAYPIQTVYITGGGSRNRTLCHWLSDALGKEVAAAASESATIGNIACQLIRLGEVSGLGQAREIIKDSFLIRPYVPSSSPWTDWDALEEKYHSLKKINQL